MLLLAFVPFVVALVDDAFVDDAFVPFVVALVDEAFVPLVVAFVPFVVVPLVVPPLGHWSSLCWRIVASGWLWICSAKLSACWRWAIPDGLHHGGGLFGRQAERPTPPPTSAPSIANRRTSERLMPATILFRSWSHPPGT